MMKGLISCYSWGPTEPQGAELLMELSLNGRKHIEKPSCVKKFSVFMDPLFYINVFFLPAAGFISVTLKAPPLNYVLIPAASLPRDL